MTPKVTVGIPFFNSAETLMDAVRSVFAQSFHDWELILLDDGSTDGSFELVSDIDDSRVRLLRDGRNLKLPTRLNQIARLASAPYLARMDADDLMHPDRLALQVAYLDAHPHCDVLGTAKYAIDIRDSVFGVERFPTDRISPRRLLSHAILCHPSVMARTSWFRENPYSVHYPRAEDHELWVRTFDRCTITSLDEPLLFFRELGTMPVDKYRASARDTRKVIRKYGSRHVGWWEWMSMIAASHGKEWVYRLLGTVKLTDVAVRRRSTSLSRVQMQRAEAAIRQIKGTAIPMRSQRSPSHASSLPT